MTTTIRESSESPSTSPSNNGVVFPSKAPRGETPELIKIFRAVNGHRLLFRSSEIKSIVKASGFFGAELTTTRGCAFEIVTSFAEKVMNPGERPADLPAGMHYFVWSQC